MPKNKVSDVITDQEIAFARLLLAGTMTDRHAAKAAGLHPNSAAYTKSKPRVRAYMLEHRAAVQQQLIQEEAEGLHRLNLDREKVLNRLWEIANLSSEMTRGSITGQVKALSMILAIQNLIPDRRAVDRLALSSEKTFATPPTPQIYPAACPPHLSRHALELAVGRAPQQATTIDPKPPTPAPAHREDSAARPACPGMSWGVTEPAFAPDPGPSQSTIANRFAPSQARGPYVPLFDSVPDLGIPFSKQINPFVRPR
jgi:hypothetical protein